MSPESDKDRGNRGGRGKRRRFGRRDNRHSNGGFESRQNGSSNKSGGILGFLKSLFGLTPKKQSAPQRSPRPEYSNGHKESAPSEAGSSNRIQRMLEEKPEVSTPKLYVGNLNYEVSESDLFDLFSQVGAVKNVEIVRDRSSRSKGFGFVEMQELDTAKAASEKLHRSDLKGRPLVVSGAKSS